MTWKNFSLFPQEKQSFSWQVYYPDQLCIGVRRGDGSLEQVSQIRLVLVGEIYTVGCSVKALTTTRIFLESSEVYQNFSVIEFIGNHILS